MSKKDRIVKCPECGQKFVAHEVYYETDNPYEPGRMIGPYGVQYDVSYYVVCPHCDAEISLTEEEADRILGSEEDED